MKQLCLLIVWILIYWGAAYVNTQAQHKKKLTEKEWMEQTIIQQDDQIRKDKEQVAILQEQLTGITRQRDACYSKIRAAQNALK